MPVIFALCFDQSCRHTGGAARCYIQQRQPQSTCITITDAAVDRWASKFEIDEANGVHGKGSKLLTADHTYRVQCFRGILRRSIVPMGRYRAIAVPLHMALRHLANGIGSASLNER